MAKKHFFFKSSTSFAIREMQIKAASRFILPQSEWPTSLAPMIAYASEDVGEEECLHITGGRANCIVTIKISMEVP